MARKKSARGYSISRYNRLGHGVEVPDVLPSRGPQKCFHAASCPVAEDPEWHHLCVEGGKCPYEAWILGRYVESARLSFSFCREWLSEGEFETTIHELGIVELQRARLSGLVAVQGFTRAKVHPVSGVHYGLEMNLGVGRYATALDNRFNALIGRILPQDPATAAGQGA